MSTINGPIQLKRGENASSTGGLTYNQGEQILAAGEPFYHVPTGKLFIGNGANQISGLPHIQLKGGQVSIGQGSSAKETYRNQGVTTIAIGEDCIADGSISIGHNAISVKGGIALGDESSQEYKSICIGENSRSARNNSVVIGNGSKVTNKNSDATENAIAIGTSAEAMSGSSIAIGRTCVAGGDGTSQTGNSCIAVGEDAKAIGDISIAIGAGANTLSHNAIAFGAGAIVQNIDQYDNYGGVAIGSGSNAVSSAVVVGRNTSANFASVAVGMVAGSDRYAVAIGAAAHSEDSCVAIGDNAKARSGYSIAIGRDASTSTTGAIAIGYNAVSSDSFLINIGSYRGSQMRVGPNTVLLGHNTAISVDTPINSVAIGTGAEVTSANFVQFLSNFVPAPTLKVGRKYAYLTDNLTSDARLKQNVADADTAVCLADVNRLKVSRFEYKPFVEGIVDKHRTGWMADDVEKVFKNAVYRRDDTFPELDENGEKVYEEIELEDGTKQKVEKRFVIKDVQHLDMTTIGLPTLWGAVQELSKLMTATQERVTELENAVKALKKENTLLKKQVKALEDSQKSEPEIEA